MFPAKVQVIFANFLLIFLSKISSQQPEYDICGGRPISELFKPLKYTPYTGEEPLQIFMDKTPMFKGRHGKIYVGFVQYPDSIICVGIKKYNRGKMDEFMKSQEILDNIQSQLAEDQREHLIKMIDAGDLPRRMIGLTAGGGVIIMEWANGNFADFIYRQQDAPNEDSIITVLKKLVQPLREMHQVALHLDFNPNNVLYVKDDAFGEQSRLKLVDFDGSVLLPLSQLRRANMEVTVEKQFATTLYAPPEHWADKHTSGASSEGWRQVSTKTDIWAFGIIIYEIILAQPSFNPKITNQKILLPKLIRMGDLYRGFRTSSKGAKLNDLYKDKAWVYRNRRSIRHILDTWIKYPRVAMLITNILAPESLKHERMSAIGIESYLNGTCVPSELLAINDLNLLRMFYDWTFGEFRDFLVKRRRWARRGCGVFRFVVRKEPYSRLLRQMDKVQASAFQTLRQMRLWESGNWLDRLRAPSACDTETA